jgi:hypothetical protein
MRVSRKRAKPGELRMFHGRLPGEQVGDLSFLWGDGVCRGDAALLQWVISSTRRSLATGDPLPSLLDELERRGYDLTTIEFRIRKRPEPANPHKQTP